MGSYCHRDTGWGFHPQSTTSQVRTHVLGLCQDMMSKSIWFVFAKHVETSSLQQSYIGSTLQTVCMYVVPIARRHNGFQNQQDISRKQARTGHWKPFFETYHIKRPILPASCESGKDKLSGRDYRICMYP